MNLSPHLSEEEFLTTQHRDLIPEQWRLWNADLVIRDNAATFANDVFEPVRTLLGVPLHVNSGYRCALLNTAVKGAPTSRHMLGLAADVVPIGMDLGKAMEIIFGAVMHGSLPHLDIAIIECNAWLHLQGAEVGHRARGKALASADGKTFTPYA